MAYGNPLAELPRLRAGIGKMESGNDYSALGPVIKRKQGTDRAYGKYGVMGENIPSWTEKALGRPLTAFEFLHSPEAQEKVFENQMSSNLLKYGSAKDAASIWFSGRPYAEAARAGARDINMPVSQYVNSVMGGGPEVRGEQYAENQPAEWASDWTPSRLAPQNAPRPAVEWAEEWTPSRLETAPTEAAPTTGGVEFLEDSKIQPDELAAKGQPLPAQAGQPVPVKPIPAPVVTKPAPWGMAEEAANALLAGYLPEAMAPFTGRTAEEYQKGKQIYEREYPLRSGLAEVGGGVAQGLALGLTGMGAVGAVAPRIAQAVPRLRPAIQTAQRWMAGQAGRTAPFPSGGTLRQPGMVAAAERVAAPIVGGGLAGGMNAFINQRLRPDVPVGEQVAEGALFGSFAQPLTHLAFGRPGPTFAPHIEESARQNAILARNKYNIPITPWQVSPLEEEQQIARQAVSSEQGLEQVKKIGEEVGKTFNHSGPFTETEVGKSVDAIGNVMETAANGIRLPSVNRGTTALAHDIINLANEITNDVVDDAERNKLLRMVQKFSDRLLLTPVSGSVIQNLTQKNGYIDKNLNPASNSLNKYFNARMKDLVYDYFYRADPAHAMLWEELRNAYKNSLLGLKIATPSGIPDVSKLQEAAKKVRARGNMAELAEISSLIPKVVNKGTGAVERIGKEAPRREGGHYGIFGTAAAGGLTGSAIERLYPEISKQIFEGSEMPLMPALFAAGSGAALYGGKKAYEAARDRFLQSPIIQNQILAGRGPAMQQAAFVNPLTSGAVSGRLTYQERRKKREKK